MPIHTLVRSQRRYSLNEYAAEGVYPRLENPVTDGLLMDIDCSYYPSVFSDAARTIPATSGSVVRGISDLSGNNNHWVQAGADSLCPIYKKEVGYPNTYVDYSSATTMYMNFTNTISTIRTAIWVLKDVNTTDQFFYFGDGTNYNFHSDTSFGYFHTSYSTVNALWINGTSRAINYARDANKNVVAATTSINSVASVFTRDRNDAYNSFRFRGNLWRVCCYNKVLSAGERQSIEAAFAAGYGI